jgi:hypothetical protein
MMDREKTVQRLDYIRAGRNSPLSATIPAFALLWPNIQL